MWWFGWLSSFSSWEMADQGHQACGCQCHIMCAASRRPHGTPVTGYITYRLDSEAAVAIEGIKHFTHAVPGTPGAVGISTLVKPAVYQESRHAVREYTYYPWDCKPQEPPLQRKHCELQRRLLTGTALGFRNREVLPRRDECLSLFVLGMCGEKKGLWTDDQNGQME